MTISFRIILTLGLVFLPLAGLAQQRQSSSPKLDAIAPFLDGQTVAVGHLALAKIDFQAGMDFFAKDFPADLLTPQQRAEAVAKGTEIRDKLVKAGCSDVFVVVSLADIPPAEPLVVLALAKDAKPEAAADVLRSLGPGPQVEPMHGALVIAGHKTIERLKTLEATPRPDLARAFQAAGDSAVQVVVSPSDDTRRALRESLPALPAELGGLSGAELVDNFGSLTLAANPPPKPSLSLTLKAKDARAAAQLSTLANKSLELLAKNEHVERQFPPIKQLVPFFQPKVQGDQLVLKIDEEQGNLSKIMDELIRPAIVSARAEANRMQSSNNLKQILIGMHVYHDTHKSFPPQASRKDDKKLLSWRVHLLPFLEQKGVYDEFHLDEPWDSEHNKKLIEKMPQFYAGQGLTPEQVKEGKTNYLVPVGPKTVFEGQAAARFADIRDGTSNTIALVEVAPEHAVVWTKPDDWNVDFSKPFVGLMGKKVEGKPAPAGFNAALCDGSVRFLSTSIGWETMRKLLQKDDGEPVGDY